MRRLVAAAVIPVVVVGALVGWLLAATGDRLPEELATHWNGAGEPDGFSSLGSFLWTTLAIGVTMWLLASVLALALGPSLRAFGNLAAWFPGAFAGFTGALIAVTIWANLDVAAAEAELSPVAVNAPVLGLLVGAATGGLIARSPRAEAPDGSAPAPDGSATMPSGDVLSIDLVWRGAWWLVASMAAVFGVVAVVSQLVLPLLLVPLIAGLVHYRLTIGPAGVAVSGGLFGWPSTTIPIEQIASAECTEVRAFREWGGWGLRIRLDGAQGLITRSGPALQLHLDDRKRFVATIDDPERAVEVLRGHLETVEP